MWTHVFYVRLHMISPWCQNVGVRTVILARDPCKNTYTHTAWGLPRLRFGFAPVTRPLGQSRVNHQNEKNIFLFSFFFLHTVVTKESRRRTEMRVGFRVSIVNTMKPELPGDVPIRLMPRFVWWRRRSRRRRTRVILGARASIGAC